MSHAPEPFRWQPYFATGLPTVDAQHMKLVGLVNTLSARLAHGQTLTQEEQDRILQGLQRYAILHFQTEEHLMADVGVDARHVRQHCHDHASFAHQVTEMASHLASGGEEQLQEMIRFVTVWLTVHILGTDQYMARQIAAIQRGMQPADAYRHEEQDALTDPGNAALLNAVQELYALVMQRNHALAHANRELEARVARRTHELQETVHKLEQVTLDKLASDQLVAVGQLAAGLAHEINTPLGFVRSNINSLQNYSQQLLALLDTVPSLLTGEQQAAWQQQCTTCELPFIREDLPALLGEAIQGIERIQHIVHDMRAFTETDGRQRELTDLNDMLRRCLHLFAGQIPAGIRVIQQFGVLPRISVQPAALTHACQHLIRNALQAIGTTGTLNLQTRICDDTLEIEIGDDGVGMPPSVVERAFDPFFTTRPIGEGSGLGLSLVHQVIKQHHGQIKIDSQPGAGTRIRLRLPRDGAHPPQAD